MKNYVKKILEIYNNNIIEKKVNRKKGNGQIMKIFKNKDVVNEIEDLTKEEFKNIHNEYKDVVIKFKTGPMYNLAQSPWIQFYYLEKNATGTKGTYCGISIDREKEKISMWIGFGETGLKKSQIQQKKETLTWQYKQEFGNKLERDFKYKSIFVDAVIIAKEYDIANISDASFEEDLKYLLNLYMTIENNNLIKKEIVYKEDIPQQYPKNKTIEGKNIIYKGYPGSGKSYTIEKEYLKDKNGNPIDERCYERVVFYPEYTNADFTGTIRPTIKNHQPTYEFFPGPFTTILKRALEHPETNFYLIIEEINRGNAESIFGDILLLLDRNTEGRSQYSITNHLIASYIYDDENKKIFIPNNLSIIASMNASDENVKTLDTAFTRRWDDIWILNETGIYDNDYIKGLGNIKWGTFRTIINKYITSQPGIINNEDKQLGAYFITEKLTGKNLTTDKNDRTAFLYKVILYLYTKVCKYNKEIIFNQKIDTMNTLITTFLSNQYLTIFKEDILKEISDLNEENQNRNSNK